MNKQRSGALVDWLFAIVIIAGAFAWGCAHGENAPTAKPQPIADAPAGQPPSRARVNIAEEAAKLSGLIVVGVDGDAQLFFFLDKEGKYGIVTALACAESDDCFQLYQTLSDEHKVDFINLRTHKPDTKTAEHSASSAPPEMIIQWQKQQ